MVPDGQPRLTPAVLPRRGLGTGVTDHLAAAMVSGRLVSTLLICLESRIGRGPYSAVYDVGYGVRELA